MGEACRERGLPGCSSSVEASPCAIMCAEAVWWRCHRRVIADYLLSEGETVFHILSRDHIEPARLTDAARAEPDGTVSYPALN